jgi:hypothetical protein
MSYSRWSNSTWYTFWTAFSERTEYKFPTQKLKETQVFEICDFPSLHFTYKEIAEGLDPVLEKVRETYSKPYEGNMLVSITNGKAEYEPTTYNAKSPTDDELMELTLYLLEFKRDVDHHFEPFNFFLYEWYYPTRNRIHWKIRDFSAWISD